MKVLLGVLSLLVLAELCSAIAGSRGPTRSIGRGARGWGPGGSRFDIRGPRGWKPPSYPGFRFPRPPRPEPTDLPTRPPRPAPSDSPAETEPPTRIPTPATEAPAVEVPSGCVGLTREDIDKFSSRPNVTVRISEDNVNIYSNGWPDHAFGPFPSPDNPNTIGTQSHDFEIPLCPVVDPSGGSCMPGGPIGVAVNGIPIFNPFNINGEDALETEVMDSCDGHPDPRSTYHYHSHPGCLDNGEPEFLIGVAYDGFPIVGPINADGSQVTSADLDECHGETTEDGGYRYRITFEYPYILGCFKGETPPAISQRQSGRNCLFARSDRIVKRSISSKYEEYK